MKTKASENKNSLALAAILTLLLALLFFWIHLWQGPLRDEENLLPAETRIPESLSGAGQLVLGRKIDLNRASPDDLKALPGLGQKLAERIVKDRQEKGKFNKIESLMRVKGIKEKKWGQIKRFIQVCSDAGC